MTLPARCRHRVIVALLAMVFVTTIGVRLVDSAPPNILFIFCDDLAYQAIGAYGSKLGLATPNMDRLAREGMLFRNCCVTNSICGPSRAVCLMGKFSHLNGFLQNGDRFDGSQPTMPKMLQA